MPPLQIVAVALDDQQLATVRTVADNLRLVVETITSLSQWEGQRSSPPPVVSTPSDDTLNQPPTSDGGNVAELPPTIVPKLATISLDLSAAPATLDAACASAVSVLASEPIEPTTLFVVNLVDIDPPTAASLGLGSPENGRSGSSDRVESPVILLVCDSDPLTPSLRIWSRTPVEVIGSPPDPAQLHDAIVRATQWVEFRDSLRNQYRQRSEILRDLTDRQREVLEMVMSGLPTKAIAGRLGVSKRLVEVERSHLLKAFDVSGTAEMTAIMGGHRMLEQIVTRFDAAVEPVAPPHLANKPITSPT